MIESFELHFFLNKINLRIHKQGLSFCTDNYYNLQKPLLRTNSKSFKITIVFNLKQ